MSFLKIDEKLKEHDMTQADLAKKLGVSRQSVQYWCSGKFVPRLPMLCKIAKVLHCHVEDLVNEEEV